MGGVLLANVLADVLLSLFSLSQLGGCRQRTAGVAWEELQGKASPSPTPTLTLTLLLTHHSQTKSSHGTPLILRGWKELGYLSRVCCLGGKVCRTVGEGESLTHPFSGSLAGAVIDLPVGTQQVASEVKKKRQKESTEGVKYSLNHGYNGAGKTAKQCEFVWFPSTTRKVP